MSKTVQTALGQPYSNCNETKDYRQVNCRDECYDKKMSEICECAFPTGCGFAFNNDWSLDCEEAFWKKTGSIKSKCSLTCAAECVQVNFEEKKMDVEWELEAEYIDYYKTKVSKKFDITGITDDQFSKRITKIHIYFSKLETTKITQSPSMTLTKLIANVGGLLGKSLC